MKNNILFSVVIIVVFSVIIFFLLTQQTGRVDNQPIVSPNNQGGLETYINDVYSFSFKYPSSYRVESFDNKEREIPSQLLFNISLVRPEDDALKLADLGSDVLFQEIDISIWNNSKKLSAVDWAKANEPHSNYSSKEFNPPFFNSDVREINMGGHKALSYYWTSYEGQRVQTVIVENGETLILLNPSFREETDQVLKDFEVVLTSLEFTQ